MDIGTEQVHGEAVCVTGKRTAEVASESARHAKRVPNCRRDLGLRVHFSTAGIFE